MNRRIDIMMEVTTKDKMDKIHDEVVHKLLELGEEKWKKKP